MFIEPTRRREPPHLRTGWIEVICGSMFSGKTEELIRRLTRARIAKLEVRIFKPAIDTRYHEENIVSHSALTIPSIPVQTAGQILASLRNSQSQTILLIFLTIFQTIFQIIFKPF